MLLVVDANRVFSALLSKGKVFSVFLVNKLRNKFEFVAPEFLLYEIGKHLDEIVKRSKLSSNELAEAFRFIKEETDFVPLNEFNKFADEAEQISPHSKDVQYFALALSLNCAIWSDEVAFKKQSKVKVFNTDEILDLLLSKLENLTK